MANLGLKDNARTSARIEPLSEAYTQSCFSNNLFLIIRSNIHILSIEVSHILSYTNIIGLLTSLA